MHALLVPFGSAGDVYPFVALGLELKRRGHRTTMITSEYFGDLARSAGFEFTASLSSEAYLDIVSDPDYWHPLRSTRLLLDRSVNPAIAVIYELLRAAYRPGESAVVAGTLALGARVAHDKLGIPLTTVHLQPSAIRSCHEPAVHPGFGWMHRLPLRWRPLAFRLIDAIADRLYARSLNAFRATLGLAPITQLFGSWWHSPESTLALFPPWYAAPQPDWPSQVKICGFPLYEAESDDSAAELERYLSAGEAPIVFTSGSAMTSADDFFAASSEACRLLGRRALLVTRFTRQLPPRLPPGVSHLSYVPFSRLLPRAAAFVHHGGIGTVAQALRAGVPQLIAPCCYDQHDNAAHLHSLGVGVTLARNQYTATRVAAELGALLADLTLQRRCRELATRFVEGEGDPVAQAADAIERYWSERRKLDRGASRVPSSRGSAASAPTAA
ncbi:MAG TPA: nucleotide disphospho-sugar-binding domain-containing protein [Steroidobacteraceae bacterium]|nr:nucleotide disphospho-sugar-binding domain-containing protein [Steroidobacteraceae bacterium]